MKTEKEIKATARKIARLTDNNAHNYSILELAKFMEDKDAIEKMEAIIEKHEKRTYMELEWMSERDVIRKALLNRVIFEYGEKVRNLLNGSF